MPGTALTRHSCVNASAASSASLVIAARASELSRFGLHARGGAGVRVGGRQHPPGGHGRCGRSASLLEA
jgi:hypothetical protein